jgi:hypothetical protein
MIKYNKRFDRKSTICFLLIDDTFLIKDNYVKELIKNISDYTISNITDKGYDLFHGQHEDSLLNQISDVDYTHCVVFTTGTEFINGEAFFETIEDYIKNDFLIAGHILDRKEAYYELHNQCYIINLKLYKTLNKPIIGQEQLGSKHRQTKPWRSYDNIHDDYTPTSISGGEDDIDYSHKMHGYNILRTAFDNDLPVLVFDSNIRRHKKYHYYDSLDELSWIYFRQSYAQNIFVHKNSNEFPPKNFANKVTEIFTPASGDWWFDNLDTENKCKVVFYDYNQQSLDHWKQNCKAHPNVSYEFVLIDLMSMELDLTQYLTSTNPLINLSNIFCYEGTIAFATLKYRLHRENKLIYHVIDKFPNSYLYFCNRTCSGFTDVKYFDIAKHFTIIELDSLKTPTYHQNGDWCV